MKGSALAPKLAGRTAGLLFVGSSLAALAYAGVVAHGDVSSRTAAFVLLGLAAGLGAGAYAAPWDRWDPRATLALPPTAFALIAIGNYLGAVPSSAFAVLFLVTFAWVGVAQQRWTSLYLVAPAAAAYVLPLVARPSALDAGSAVITIPVCVVVAESLAWIGHRERHTRSVAEALAGTASSLAASIDKDAVLAVLVEEARRATGSQHGVLFEGDPDTFTIRRVHTSGIDQRYRSMYEALAGTSYADVPAVRGFAAMAGPIVVNDTAGPHGYPKELIEPFGVKCFIAVPLVANGTGVGILTCGNTTSARTYTQDDVSLVAALAQQASSTIHNALMYGHSLEAARRDPVTGMANRLAFDERVTSEMDGSRRSDGRFSLILFDIDGFKSINDAPGRGHIVGDAALRRVGSFLQASCRAGDGAYRLGGDEFALLLPQTDLKAALSAADRIRKDITTLRLDGYEDVLLSVSGGVSVFPADGADAVALFAAADSALYSVKRSGGNAVAAA